MLSNTDTNTTTSSVSSPLLVTGASGKLGKAVIRHLLATLQVDPKSVIAGTRSPDKLSALAALGVQVRHLDFHDAASIPLAAKDAKRALIISTTDQVRRAEVHEVAIKELAKAGVEHILYASHQGVEDSIAVMADDHRATEQTIKEEPALVGYTFLRNGMYFENHLFSLAAALKSGKWFSAAQDGKLSAIARDDLARAAAVALANGDNTARRIYELSGGEALSTDEFVATLSAATGKPIQVIPVSPEALAQGMAAATGLPMALTAAVASIDANTAAGFGATVTDDYKKLTGLEPQRHADWVSANKEHFRLESE